MHKFQLTIVTMGSRGVLINWPHSIEEEILKDITLFTPSLVQHFDSKIINYVSGYNSILLHFDIDIELEKIQTEILDLYSSLHEHQSEFSSIVWHVPVCYHDDLGPDIPLFQSKNGLSKEELIRLHAENPLRVYMIGFLPGFLYLGGMDERLHMARKESPRRLVPKGAVAIGGEQTGIYPMSSPGGWQIIGRTPLTLFDSKKDEPTPIRQGDLIQFYPISKHAYDILSSH